MINMNDNQYICHSSEIICHAGKKGMKWGQGPYSKLKGYVKKTYDDLSGKSVKDALEEAEKYRKAAGDAEQDRHNNAVITAFNNKLYRQYSKLSDKYRSEGKSYNELANKYGHDAGNFGFDHAIAKGAYDKNPSFENGLKLLETEFNGVIAEQNKAKAEKRSNKAYDKAKDYKRISTASSVRAAKGRKDAQYKAAKAQGLKNKENAARAKAASAKNKTLKNRTKKLYRVVKTKAGQLFGKPKFG